MTAWANTGSLFDNVGGIFPMWQNKLLLSIWQPKDLMLRFRLHWSELRAHLAAPKWILYPNGLLSPVCVCCIITWDRGCHSPCPACGFITVPLILVKMRERHCLPSSMLRELCDYASYTFLGFYNPITQGRHEGFPVQILTKLLRAFQPQLHCHHCHASITRSHLFLNFTVAEEFKNGPQPLDFYPGCAGGGTTGLLDGNYQLRPLITYLKLTSATRERSFEGVPFCHVSICMSIYLGFAFGRGQNSFARKQVIQITVTQTRGRLQILDLCLL